MNMEQHGRVVAQRDDSKTHNPIYAYSASLRILVLRAISHTWQAQPKLTMRKISKLHVSSEVGLISAPP